ncbi:MAG: hypothetical protein ACT4RN_05685 [Pseudonocardia sp.]
MTIFMGLDAEWAFAIRRTFTEVADRSTGDPRVVDTRICDDLALLVRYVIRGAPLAVRYRLDVDPGVGGRPIDADRLASHLFHDLHASDPPSFTDADGYHWWGDEPPHGWASLQRYFRSA